MEKALEFCVNKKLGGTLARTGIIRTPHGCINTPAFIVGGTKATVKTLSPEQIDDIGGQAVLVNAYHLMLRPGSQLIEQIGGVHKFMNYDKPIFSDSGGFQVFSLGMAYKKGIDITSHSIKGDAKKATHSKSQLTKVTEDGVSFRSHLDGSSLFITPEMSMEIQHSIGADIHMCFDELISPLAGRNAVKKAMVRTHQWAQRCIKHHSLLNNQHMQRGENQQALFGVVQGAREQDFRRQSADFLCQYDFDGFGIGGVFEPEEIPSTVRWVCEQLPTQKPRHLLGMGAQPADLFLGVEFGIDTFDCVAPTRQARNGALYTYDGRINIRNSKYYDDFLPIEPDCSCYVCKNFTRAYLHHLFRCNEVFGLTLASIHNEFFVVNVVDHIRSSIDDGSYFDYKRRFIERYYGVARAVDFL